MAAAIIELPSLRLITVRAARFPEGTREAFAALEGKLSTLRGRRMYGLVYSTPAGLEYHAGLVPESEEEVQRFGFPVRESPAGRWARTKLMNWEEHLSEIGPTIGRMIGEFGIDASRPTLEYYRSHRELHLMVPLP